MVYHWSVVGKTSFPLDILRVYQAWPQEMRDSTSIEETFKQEKTEKISYVIRLCSLIPPKRGSLDRIFVAEGWQVIGVRER